ncbi:FAD-linked oxidase-like protein [Thelonectria olida]|uniref:FAD-linked oxidase-like protein n=1 Tax=Thelonectria olida TaxID=1576542 RepID=A0A9P9AFV1_9HYPO|nr:FAD-linked oxidase-like protein [Thelonectria olida]
MTKGLDHTTRPAAEEIEAALGEGAMSYDDGDIEAHGFSDWPSINSAGRWLSYVARAASICHQRRVPVVPCEPHPRLRETFASPYGGIIIDFTGNIIAFHPDDMDIVTIEHEKLILPLDPSPAATIGGMVLTNCSGTNAFRYGTMKDWVINVTTVLADGQVIKTRHRPRKTSAGYNLTSLFVGAEGTLVIIAEITLKLAVIPKETSVAVVGFDTISEAASAASKIIRSGIQLAAMELMDDVQMRTVDQHDSEDVRKMGWMRSLHSFSSIQVDISQVRDLIQSSPQPARYVFAKDKDEEAKLWAARKDSLWTMTSISLVLHAIWPTDVAVAISRLAEIINVSKEGEKPRRDGNFHEALMYDPKNPEHQAAVEEAVRKMVARALEMQGTVSGEHAIGMGKMLKHAVDPRWILNPGKVFDLPNGSKATAMPNQTSS